MIIHLVLLGQKNPRSPIDSCSTPHHNVTCHKPQLPLTIHGEETCGEEALRNIQYRVRNNRDFSMNIRRDHFLFDCCAARVRSDARSELHRGRSWTSGCQAASLRTLIRNCRNKGPALLLNQLYPGNSSSLNFYRVPLHYRAYFYRYSR